MSTAELATVLHAEMCGKGCVSWTAWSQNGEMHRNLYRDRAETLTGWLGPVIGAANVLVAVEAVLRMLASRRVS